MVSRIINRPHPPCQEGSLKGLRGIPPPSLDLHVFSPGDKPNHRRNIQEEEELRQWGSKIVRRLLLKAGLPLLTVEECRGAAGSIFFKVQMRVSLVHKAVVCSSVIMEIIEEVVLTRDSTIKIEAVTWSYGPIIGHYYQEKIDEDEWVEEAVTRLIRSDVRRGIQELAADYQCDNVREDSV